MNQNTPTLDQFGTLRYPDGSTFFSPVVCSGAENVEDRNKELRESSDLEELKIDHSKCHSGKCQQAFMPRCKCKCHGKGHQSKRRSEYGYLDDYLGEKTNNSPAPVGLYA